MRTFARSLGCTLLIFLSAQIVPATAAWGKSKSLIVAQPDNAEMSTIFKPDQDARQDVAKIDWIVLLPEDEARRVRTKALLDAGKLRSGTDFYHAAFVFQHG